MNMYLRPATIILVVFLFCISIIGIATAFDSSEYAGYNFSADSSDAMFLDFVSKAMQGDVDAQFGGLGRYYERAYGVEKDHEKTVYWYTKAFEQGYDGVTRRLRDLSDQLGVPMPFTKIKTPTPTITQPNPANQNGNEVKQSSAVVIEPGKSGEGYSWSSDGSILTITGASHKYTLSSAISNRITINVDADKVTLDGNNVPITGIRGNPTLDLVNVHVDGGISHRFESSEEYFEDSKLKYELFYGITECRNIKNSSIIVKRDTRLEDGYDVYGIGVLYGNLDDTTTVTVTVPIGDFLTPTAIGVVTDSGIVSGGKFTLRGQRASGVDDLYGEISGGEFTSNGKNASGVGIVHETGKVSGGEFIVTGNHHVYGVIFVMGEISGGEFTVTGDYTHGVEVVRETGKVSGGEFILTGDSAIGFRIVEINGKISGGEFIVNGVRQPLPR